MSEGASRFYNSIKDAVTLEQKELVGLFAYYLTVEAGENVATSKSIDGCFTACDITPPSRTAQYLSEGVASKNFVKADRGYKLQRHYRETLSKKMGAEQIVLQTSAELRKLENELPAGSKKDFLKETINCFEAGANRATIVMCWILALDHLIDYVMNKHAAAFDKVLAVNTDKRVKVTSIRSRDDFGDIPEGKLIEFIRSAGAISNDVRKILEEKLGTRNSCAHPSGISIKRTKVIDFVEDLITNVVLKYKI
jgi:hypothetical protein